MITRQEMGRTIRQARLDKGYTQQYLGEMVGYEKNASAHVREWESGRYYPPYQRLRAISQVLGIPLEKLIP